MHPALVPLLARRPSRRRSAVLTIEGTERSFRAGGVHGVLDGITAFVQEEVAVPRLRPVVATIVGLPAGPSRVTCTPAKGARFEYPDQLVAPRLGDRWQAWRGRP